MWFKPIIVGNIKKPYHKPKHLYFDGSNMVFNHFVSFGPKKSKSVAVFCVNFVKQGKINGINHILFSVFLSNIFMNSCANFYNFYAIYFCFFLGQTPLQWKFQPRIQLDKCGDKVIFDYFSLRRSQQEKRMTHTCVPAISYDHQYIEC